MPKILVVDDEPLIREMFTSFLEEGGKHKVSCAVDGSDGYRQFTEAKTSAEPFALVLTDGNMPKMTGHDLLRVIEAIEEDASQKTPIILITAETSVHPAGFSAVIPKPVRLKVIEAIVDAFTR